MSTLIGIISSLMLLGWPFWGVTQVAAAPTATPIRRATLSAWVACNRPGQGGTQTVYVRLVDADGRPVAGVPVSVIVRDGTARPVYTTAPTSAEGYASCILPVNYPVRGSEVTVEVSAVWAGGEARAYTSYVVW